MQTRTGQAIRSNYMSEKSNRDWSWAELKDWISLWTSPDSKTRTKENLNKKAVKSIATVLTVKQITKGE